MARIGTTRTAARAAHDVGLASWFGGSLMGAVGVNGAAADVDDPRQRARVANAGWARWTPVSLAGIGLHLLGSVLLLRDDGGPLERRARLSSWGGSKNVLTVVALLATAYSRALGQRVIGAGDVPVEAGTVPSPATPPEVGGAQRQLSVLQWIVPALTGALLVLGARLGERQRPGAPGD